MSRKQEDHVIVAIHITDRMKQAARVQQVFTQYGGLIKTRLGLHETAGKAGSPQGIILLELVGAEKHAGAIIKALNAIAGVEAKSIVFEH
jgi:hypothetical protein